MIIISKHVLWKVRNSFVFEMVGLGSLVGSGLFPVDWRIALVCWLRSVTTVFLPVLFCQEMGTNQKSPDSDFFFLTDENDG